MASWWNGIHSRLKICRPVGLMGSSPIEATNCGSSSAVEPHVANVAVAGSNPVSRSILLGRIPAVLYAVHETRVNGACGFEPRRPYHYCQPPVQRRHGKAPRRAGHHEDRIALQMARRVTIPMKRVRSSWCWGGTFLGC